MAYPTLAIVDRAYRGAVEVQFFDTVYGALDFAPLLGRADLALRGLAVTLAVREDAYRPVLRLGAGTLDTLPDYRGGVRALLAAGARVFVDGPDLDRLGFTGPHDLLDGAERVDTNDLAATWAQYEAVWFL